MDILYKKSVNTLHQFLSGVLGEKTTLYYFIITSRQICKNIYYFVVEKALSQEFSNLQKEDGHKRCRKSTVKKMSIEKRSSSPVSLS